MQCCACRSTRGISRRPWPMPRDCLQSSRRAPRFSLLTVYRNGKKLEETEWDQTKPADKTFERLGLYLPACYPCRENGEPWIAASSGCVDRIERADILNLEGFLRSRAGKQKNWRRLWTGQRVPGMCRG